MSHWPERSAARAWTSWIDLRQLEADRPLAAASRAARGLICLTQTELAEAAGVRPETLRDFEAGRGQQTRGQVEAIRAAIKSAGMEFTGEGVRWALPPLEPVESNCHFELPRLVGGPVDNPERAAANRARVDGRNTPELEPDPVSKDFISAARGRKQPRR
jgi:transcriptional regulator with XRE-family HTH domain